MSQPYVGEIRMFGFNRTPVGWFACDGSLQPISGYEALYNLIGTTYGGNGTNNFGLPDLRGRIPIHQGTGQGLSPKVLGQPGGVEQVTLLTSQIPQHSHLFTVSTQGATAASPGNTVTLAQGASGDGLYYSPPTGGTSEAMTANSCTKIGSSLPHDNLAPTLTVSICIAWAGIYPSQS
jgi:microcystin-dependent protein